VALSRNNEEFANKGIYNCRVFYGVGTTFELATALTQEIADGRNEPFVFPQPDNEFLWIALPRPIRDSQFGFIQGLPVGFVFVREEPVVVDNRRMIYAVYRSEFENHGEGIESTLRAVFVTDCFECCP